MRRSPPEWVLVLCRACDARLPLPLRRAPARLRCLLCRAVNDVPKLGRPRRARAYSRT